MFHSVVLCAILVDLSSRTIAAAPANSSAFESAEKIVDQTIAEAHDQPTPSTGITKADYLKLVAADVDHFKGCQDKTGAIIDPYVHREIQYSTPAFALAAARLVVDAQRTDLLPPATKAMTWALSALTEHRAADGHSDFYIPLLVHAYELLHDKAPPETVATWQKQFRSIIPEKIYHMDKLSNNWNIVSDSGELLRRKDGLVDPGELDRQEQYLEKALTGHLKSFTASGLMLDPGAPLAYDAFSRLWLEDMFADGGYTGRSAQAFQEHLSQGAVSSLLLLSPTGEWASGGRSALHQWNEAENLAIFEIEARKASNNGRVELAKTFKRAAHLAFESMKRWQRPQGDLWIVKNRADPSERLGFEIYSYHTQYNLLPMAMLAMAYGHADDSISESLTPSEIGSYVFDLRQPFHKVVAAAAGYYALIDTGADLHYNATGLQRVSRVGVPFSALSDSVAPERAIGPNDAPKTAIAPGISWRESPSAEWLSLADYTRRGPHDLSSVTLESQVTARNTVSFSLNYTLAAPGQSGLQLTDSYVIGADGVSCNSELHGTPPTAEIRGQLPVLVSDGASELPVSISQRTIRIDNHGSITNFVVSGNTSSEAELSLEGDRTVNHNGYVKRAVIPLTSPAFSCHIDLFTASQARK